MGKSSRNDLGNILDILRQNVHGVLPPDSNLSSLPQAFQNLLDIGTGSRSDVRQGKSFSEKEKSQFAIDYQLTQEDRAWQEQIYQKYQSYSGQMNDMKAAGLNPAMMYDGTNLGSFGSASSAASSPDSSAGMGNPGLSDAMSVIQALTSIMGGASDVVGKQQDVKISKQNADSQQADITGENALRSEQIKTEQEKQNLLRQQATGQSNANKTFDEEFSWKRTNQSNKVVMDIMGINLTYATVRKIEAETSKIENDERLSNLRFDLDKSEAFSRINVNNATADNLRQEYLKIVEETKALGYANQLEDLKRIYGVEDEGICMYLYHMQGIMGRNQFAATYSTVVDAYHSNKNAVDVWKLPSVLMNGAAKGFPSLFGAGSDVIEKGWKGIQQLYNKLVTSDDKIPPVDASAITWENNGIRDRFKGTPFE